jgi:bifunctional non-homologous end joining protein LigD
VRIWSRAGNDITAAYPELVAQAADVGDALLDGEIVVFVDGRPSFDALQLRMHVRDAREARRLANETPVTFVLFDLVRRFGLDLTARPYSERRATLERWAAERPDWTLSPSFDDGAATELAARQHHLEGVVAKRVSSPYRPGVRSPDWVKLRFARAGEFVVVGWEGASDSPDELSSLVLGCYADNVLTFAGKVGSGLNAATARRLQRALHEVDACPLPTRPPASPGRRVVHWVEPSLVVEVEFANWTDDRRLRHPVFRGIRADKRPDEAVGDA